MTQTALATVEDFDHSKVDLIKATVAKGASDNELDLFLYTCKRTGLDPLARQIYFVKRQENKPGTIQTGIDGYRLIADRTGKYAGNDDPAFGATEVRQFRNYNDRVELEVPLTATVTVWKIVSGQRCPFTATARWSEYYPGDAGGQQWRKMPYLMLGKCAESLALRKAFPAELSGLYTDAEMDQAGQQSPPPRIEVVAPLTATQELFDAPREPDPRQPLRDELRQLRQELAAAGGRPSNLRSSQVMAMTAQDLKEEIALTRDELKRLPVEQQELEAAA